MRRLRRKISKKQRFLPFFNIVHREKAAILEPAVDACRTARHALSLIASLRPPALITALSKEVLFFSYEIKSIYF